MGFTLRLFPMKQTLFSMKLRALIFISTFFSAESLQCLDGEGTNLEPSTCGGGMLCASGTDNTRGCFPANLADGVGDCQTVSQPDGQPTNVCICDTDNCNLKPCVCESVKCYSGQEDDLVEKICPPGFVCAKSVSDGKRGCLPQTFGVSGCLNIPAITGEEEHCFCNTELCNGAQP